MWDTAAIPGPGAGQISGLRQLRQFQELQRISHRIHHRRERGSSAAPALAGTHQPRGLELRHPTQNSWIQAIAAHNAAAPGQHLLQPELPASLVRGLGGQLPPGDQQKAAEAMQRNRQLLSQGAGQHHRQPGTGEATGPCRNGQPSQLSPVISRQHLLHAGQQGIGQAPPQGKTLHPRGGSRFAQRLHRHPEALTGTVQNQQQRLRCALPGGLDSGHSTTHVGTT